MSSKNDENHQFYLFHYQKTELRIKSIGDDTSEYYNGFPVETHKSLTFSFGFAHIRVSYLVWGSHTLDSHTSNRFLSKHGDF